MLKLYYYERWSPCHAVAYRSMPRHPATGVECWCRTPQYITTSAGVRVMPLPTAVCRGIPPREPVACLFD
ncbi:hypothetical protein B5X24_HaOG215986 [Helicoverpa armigera]|nr:hypothetical protein B5X24_HaOG215986 [Helicoverpa armigera]